MTRKRRYTVRLSDVEYAAIGSFAAGARMPLSVALGRLIWTGLRSGRVKPLQNTGCFVEHSENNGMY